MGDESDRREGRTCCDSVERRERVKEGEEGGDAVS